ncbi:hypothetical protein A0H81_11866 [Grifola frondosa]|uniref:Csf1 N-terminal domain-containing protein n=1 Tax=Grifola frondosa TaxID=5627 RepID=A0A1C7LV95_GRIFR|nr:hypothetical protein A0H81_11866 [Grifola frondosa]
MAETCRVRCHLPTPLTWNGKRQWTFAISLRQPSLYLLRDHVNMLTDLGKDWSSGPPSDYCLFVPMMYVIDLDMHNYEINTYVNDHNIIDKPLIKEENALLTLRGTHFRHGTQLPLTKYRPDATTVSFWIEAPDVAVSLTLPRWNTSGLYPTPDRSDLGHISMLHLDASYRYHAETRKNNIDHLKLEFSAHDVVYTVFGWSIRYFMILRDNYFGSFTHFSTLFEYLEKRKNGQFIGDPIKLQYREGHSNAMQVELGVNVDAGLMVLPAGLPGYETYSADQSNSTDSDLGSCLMLFMPEIQLQLRTCDYYMEMSLNVATISGRIDEHDIKKPLSYATISRKSKETFVIDGIDIIANRLFGPQPHTSTYVCIWEIHIADVKAVLSVHEGRLLSAVGTSFGLNFSDPLNAPAKEYTLPTDPDVTFLKVSLDSLNVVWVAGNAAAELSLPDGLRIDSNDLAGNSYRKVFCFRLPLANVKALLAPNKHTPIWYEAADLKLDANLDIYSAPAGWRESAVAQTKFVIAQDALTERAKVLYDSDSLSAEALRPGHGALVNDDYLPQLRIPRRSAHTSEGDHAVRFDSNLKHPFSYSSSQVDQSESDAEDGLPDALRDARIANSRPTSAIPVTPHNDNESMSSGDESDNDDLTDPQEWTTDYSDTLDDASLDVPWPSVKWYSRLARHYCGQALTRPSFWSNSPFSLSRNVIHQDWQYKYTFGRQTAVEETLKPLPDWSELGHHEDPNADQTVIRLHLKDGVNIGLNPLILPAVTALMKDISMNQLSPELRFDAIMAQFIQSFPSSIGSRSRTTLFDLHLSSARIRSTQFVEERPRENTLGKASTSKNPGASEYASSVVDICLVGFCLRGRVARSNPDAHVQQAFACSFDSLSAALVTESTSQTAHRDDRGSMCHIAFERGYGSLIGHKIIVSLGGISTGIGHTAPEHLFATAVVVAKYGLGLVKVQKRLIVHTPALDQQIIHQVLTYSRQRSVVDPLSTIQPSYLVQTGRPDSLRKDVAFKFLVYLRNCLRYLDHRERRTIVNLHPDLHSVVALEDILMMLEDQWLNLGGDDYASELSQQPLLRELFPTHGSEIRQLSTKDDRSLDCFEIRLDALNFVIYHPSDGTQSDLSLGPLVISVNRQAGDLLQSWMWTPGKSYPNLSLREKERVDALRIIACSFSLGNVASTIYPQAMQFTQIVLRVNRHYGTRLSLSDDHSSGPHVSERTAVATTNSPVVYLVLATSIRSLRFTAAAHRLIFRFKTCAVTYASTLLAKPPSVQRISWDISTNHSLVFVQSSLQACSALDTTKLDDRDVLASLTLTDDYF